MEDFHYLEAISERLDTTLTGVGNYRVVAQYYGVNHHVIATGLERDHRGPTTALIEWLSATHPELTVQEFARVVREKAKRRDVDAVLQAYMHEAYDSKRLNRVTDAGKQFKSCNDNMHRLIDTLITRKFLTPQSLSLHST